MATTFAPCFTCKHEYDRIFRATKKCLGCEILLCDTCAKQHGYSKSYWLGKLFHADRNGCPNLQDVDSSDKDSILSLDLGIFSSREPRTETSNFQDGGASEDYDSEEDGSVRPVPRRYLMSNSWTVRTGDSVSPCPSPSVISDTMDNSMNCSLSDSWDFPTEVFSTSISNADNASTVHSTLSDHSLSDLTRSFNACPASLHDSQEMPICENPLQWENVQENAQGNADVLTLSHEFAYPDVSENENESDNIPSDINSDISSVSVDSFAPELNLDMCRKCILKFDRVNRARKICLKCFKPLCNSCADSHGYSKPSWLVRLLCCSRRLHRDFLVLYPSIPGTPDSDRFNFQLHPSIPGTPYSNRFNFQDDSTNISEEIPEDDNSELSTESDRSEDIQPALEGTLRNRLSASRKIRRSDISRVRRKISVSEIFTDSTAENVSHDICPICQDQLRRPRCLPCLHKICTKCLKRYINHNVRRHNLLTCPVCREDIDTEEDRNTNQHLVYLFPRVKMAQKV